jgi:hypothetical protein
MPSPTYPTPEHALLVSRTSEPAAREWTADDDAGHHHGLLSLNEVPCILALHWQSRARGRTVHVGTFKLNLRRLAAAGFAQAKPGRKVRLRFVRDPEGTIEIRANESSPGLPIGTADFG